MRPPLSAESGNVPAPLDSRKKAATPDEKAELWNSAQNAIAFHVREPLENSKRVRDLVIDLEGLHLSVRKTRAQVQLTDSDIGDQIDKELEALEIPILDLMQRSEALRVGFVRLSNKVLDTVDRIAGTAAQSAKDAGW
jgi:hypothetical protein